MLPETKQRLNVPYIKLKFVLAFPDGAYLPKNKVSALRGGMGEAFLRQHCVRDRACRTCEFKKTCIVYMTMYTSMEVKPPFMQGDDSVGYLLECENSRQKFAVGDELYFYLTLFGRNIEYFSLYLNAFYQFGMIGMTESQIPFRILRIETEEHNLLLTENDVDMGNFHIHTLSEYAARRLRRIQRNHEEGNFKYDLLMTFHTPLRLKYEGEFIQKFSPQAIIPAVSRRIMMLDYFTGNLLDGFKTEVCPETVLQHAYPSKVVRHSTTQNKSITMCGIRGDLQFLLEDEELVLYLLAGELLHIGKNTSFGFGRYTIRENI